MRKPRGGGTRRGFPALVLGEAGSWTAGLSMGIESELGARSLSSSPNSKGRRRFQTEAPTKVDRPGLPSDAGFTLSWQFPISTTLAASRVFLLEFSCSKKTDDTIACKRCGDVVRRSPLA